MKKLLTILCTLAVGLALGQQEAMYTQFQFNKLAINPAYAGSRDATSFTSLYRHQWVSIEGAPRTMSFNVHSPLKNKDFALGLQVTNDKLGVTNQTGVFADYAYRIPVGKGKLSLGLQGGVHFYQISLTEALSYDPSDPTLQADFQKWLPNFGAGIYYYTEKFFVGVSVPGLMQNSLSTDAVAVGEEAQQRRHYFGMAGYVFNISSTGNVKFRPSVLLKYVEETPFQADINGSFLFLDKLWLGASYRTGASIDFNLEWNLTRQLRIGYAYDYVLGELGQYTTGSHEVLIGFDLDFRNDRIVTPRNLSPIYF